MSEVLKKFGKYFLLDHIAQGGMAEIYRARLAAADGAGRLIVIKRIQAGYGTNAEFLQMFKSEIKVTMGFNHPNIVQLYDFGEENNQPFIAMELVDGKNLRQFMSRFANLKLTFPIELATYIAEQSASGLNYAHSFKDKITGEPLNIVHRDVSPQNILISFEGNVKVIDFGIAKATTNSEFTRTGVIKGKPSYLSPEQISGEVLDGRSDIFALGSVLWETLTGVKLFAGESDLAVLKLIESAQTHVKPPSTLNPKVPKELDYICLKTLSKNRDHRYQTAEELQRALHKFLYAYMPEFNPSDLAYYAKDLFKNEIVEDRKQIQKLNDKVEQLLALEAVQMHQLPIPSAAQSNAIELESREDPTQVEEKRSQARAASSGGREATFNPQTLKENKIEIEMVQNSQTAKPVAVPNRYRTIGGTGAASSSATPTSQRGQNSYQNRVPQRRPTTPEESNTGTYGKMAAIGAVLVLAVSVFGPEFGVRVPFLTDFLGDWIAGSEARVILDGNQRNVTVAVNGQTVATVLPTTLNGIPVGTPFRVTVSGTAGTFTQDMTLRKGESKEVSVVLSPEKPSTSPIAATGQAPVNDKLILLRLNITPLGGAATILLNGRPVDPAHPAITVGMDEPLELNVDRSGFKPFRREFSLDSKQLTGLRESMMDVQLEPLHFGFLTIHTTPSADATMTLDGSAWKKKTPIENERLPVGNYRIRLANDVLGMEKNINISIKEGKAINIDERLEIKN